VTDSPSCAEGFISNLPKSQILDSTQFIADHLLGKLSIKKVNQVVVHPTCSSQKIDENKALLAVAGAIAETVVVPPNWGCCAFAGDRGLIHPELTQSATKAEADYVKSFNSTHHISNNRTCEMAMTAAVGREYVSVIQLLHEVSGG
jgi:D-lactate dehydrogenase